MSKQYLIWSKYSQRNRKCSDHKKASNTLVRKCIFHESIYNATPYI